MYNVEYKSDPYLSVKQKNHSRKNTLTQTLEFTQDCIRTGMQVNFKQSLQDLSLSFEPIWN